MIEINKQKATINQVVELGNVVALTLGQGGSMNECRVYPQSRLLFVTT